MIYWVVTWSAAKVLRGSSAIFLHRTPFEQREMPAIQQDVEGVTTVDDFHAWQICSQITIATTHLETDVESMADAERVTRRVHEVLADYGVDHATVELCPGYSDRDTHLNDHCH